MITSFFRVVAGSCFIMSLMVPAVSYAATPQQIFNSSFLSTFTDKGAWAINGNIEVRLHKGRSRSVPSSPDTLLTYRIVNRFLPQGDTRRDMEGRLTMSGSAVTGSTITISPIDVLAEPLSIEWKTIGTSAYIRITTQLPKDITDLVGPEVGQLLGQWVRIDVPDDVSRALFPAATAGIASPSLSLKGNPLRVVRLIKKEVRSDAHQIARYRIEVNPAVLLKQEQSELAAARRIGSSLSYRNQIRQRQAAFRQILRSFTVIAVVDQTAGRLERMEIGGTVRFTPALCRALMQSSHSCTANMIDTAKITGGVSFIQQQAAKPIELPQTSIDLVKFIKDFLAQQLSHQEDATSSTDTQLQ